MPIRKYKGMVDYIRIIKFTNKFESVNSSVVGF